MKKQKQNRHNWTTLLKFMLQASRFTYNIPAKVTLLRDLCVEHIQERETGQKFDKTCQFRNMAITICDYIINILEVPSEPKLCSPHAQVMWKKGAVESVQHFSILRKWEKPMKRSWHESISTAPESACCMESLRAGKVHHWDSYTLRRKDWSQKASNSQ